MFLKTMEVTMNKAVKYTGVLVTLLSTSSAFASAALTASVSGLCSAPTAGTNVTLTVTPGDKFAVVLGATLATSTITPASGTTFSLTPSGTVCRFRVTSATGTIAPAANFLGMTFANPSLAAENLNVDTTGQGAVGSPANTDAFIIGALSSTVLSMTTGPGVQIKRRATGGTNFGFSSSTPIPLTAYPTDESGLTASGNAFVTIPLTLTAIPG